MFNLLCNEFILKVVCKLDLSSILRVRVLVELIFWLYKFLFRFIFEENECFDKFDMIM